MTAPSAVAIDRRLSLLRQRVREIEHAHQTSGRAPISAVDLAGRVGIQLDAWQARALTTDARELILLASRQAGKSTVAALLALHQSVAAPGSLTLIVSPTERQSKRLLRSVRKLYGPLRSESPALAEGALSLDLRNGSELHALPGSEETIRGFSAVDLLILDEGARVPDDLYGAVRPMLAVSNGRLVALSTPFGKRGWFYEEWTGAAEWHRERVPATEVPRISPEFLARERDRIGDWLYRQEYLCQFVETDDQYFSTELIAAAVSTDIAPRFPQLIGAAA